MNSSPISSNDLREKFLNFFAERGHEKVASSSLVPAGDDTLLFTNAGMVQFKDVFLGREERNYSRATTSQRCVRAGGKHNDLENVGYTARHHTFFEMLGNFSFGDYFKREAIKYAWEFLTEELGLPEDRLWITVFEEDDEAADIWLNEMGVSAERFSRIGAKDNFWSMGDTGPCGPCSEIFFDHGDHVWGGPPGTPEEDGDRYIEIWNLVFMQYNRDASGHMEPLPKPSVDTGMGLERLAAILQHVHSNYEIDMFQNLLRAVATETNSSDMEHASLRVIADHIRSCAFMIVDGVLPSNEGRGYVLRRIIRRALRHGYKLGQQQPFFNKLVSALVSEMAAAYPELKQKQAHIEKVLLREEEDFSRLLVRGMGMLEDNIAKLSGSVIPGDVAFKLYDTYGFPIDLTEDVAREKELTVDKTGYEAAMKAQREAAQASAGFDVDYNDNLLLDGDTAFCGYEAISETATIKALLLDGQTVEQVEAGQSAVVVLDKTPFYAESGGQIGDQGILNTTTASFTVHDTQKNGSNHLHVGSLSSGKLKLGDKVDAHVNGTRRKSIVANHSATHLLHSALQDILGDHVQQKGSLVTAERLRFDFSHYDPVSNAEIIKLERWVNQQITLNGEASAAEMSYDEAIESGAMALFGEKYGDLVRVMKIGNESTELCGGTHVSRTGDIGFFKIVSESSVANGIRRIEAVTGTGAAEWVQDTYSQLSNIAGVVKASPDTAAEKVTQLSERNRQLEKELAQLKSKLASSQGSDLASQAKDVNGVTVLAAVLEGVDGKALRDTMDQLKNKLGSAVVVLGVAEGEKVRLIAGVTDDLTKRFKAGELVNHVASQVGGKGGGRPDMAQAGGTEPANLGAAIDSVAQWVADK